MDNRSILKSPLISKAQAAILFCCCKRTIERKVRRGELIPEPEAGNTFFNPAVNPKLKELALQAGII